MKRIVPVILLTTALILSAHEGRAWVLFGTVPDVPAAYAVLLGTIGKYQYQPKLAKGFANASVYTSHVATLRGYQGYDRFAISVGTMAGVQAPSVTTNLSYYKSLPKKLKDQGDIYAGVAWNAWSANVGVRIPVVDLSVSAKFGKLSYTYSDYHFDGTHAGGMLNYQLVNPKAPPVKFVLWRGISIGSGFLWQNNNTNLKLKLPTLSFEGYTVKPEMNLQIKTSSYIIPLEISTAVRLLWVLNIHAGGGIDFAWGSSSIRYSSYGVALGTPSALFWAYGRQSGKGSSHYMPKIFCGPGLNFGPVIIDIPFTYYFVGGLNVGVTVGVVW